jgi:hypothetical protein
MSKFDVDVELTGTDGNAFAVLAKVRRGLKDAGATSDDIEEFTSAATAGDYHHLLATAIEWVNVH